MQNPNLPFGCLDCARRYGDANALAQHRMVVHGAPLPERPFACTHCARRFATEDGLETHARMKHPGQRVEAQMRQLPDGYLGCPYCEARFSTQHQVYQHARAKHPTRAYAHLRPSRDTDDDPSLAEIAIEAEWKHAAGLPLDALEESLLP